MKKTVKYIQLMLVLFLLGCQNNEVPVLQKSTTDLTTPDILYPALFTKVQIAGVFPDSKTFVDCRAKYSAKEINEKYNSLEQKDKEGLTQFVHEHFEVPGLISSDFKSDPSKTAEEHVKNLWPILTRKSDETQDGSTLIPLPKTYVVPGGRFREVYYWDSYFTMLGLVEHGEFELIENMLDNFAYLIEEVGHIPNGNRVYYKTRSQPPFFSQMVKLLAQEKGEHIYDKYSSALIKEYSFWMRKDMSKSVDEHVVVIDDMRMNRYYDQGNNPRQESYKEDFELVEKHNGGEKMYRDLRAGAESGWDYSSRWFSDGQNLSSIETIDIIPVDLNALMYGLESVLLEVVDHDDLRNKIAESLNARKKFLQEYMWNEDGSYEDYHWIDKKTTGIKSLAMVYPLFFQMVDQKQADEVAKYVEDHFLKDGGVVTSLNDTGQQWDSPNGWAPLQWMTVIGLHQYGHTDLAKTIAERWVALNERVYKDTGKFVEKYNVMDISLEAGGGEYPVQDGFGWSNGVYIALKQFLNHTDEELN